MDSLMAQLDAVGASVASTADIVRELFLDGFFAVMAVAVVAPWLGTLLVLRRMPLLGLAIPQVAGCGQALAFFLFARTLATVEAGHVEAPSDAVQLLGAAAGIAVGLAALGALSRGGRFLGVHAGILFVLAVALRELLFLESPYHEALEDVIHHGSILTVLPDGRNRVVVTAAILLPALIAFRRPLWLTAFDPDQARLAGRWPTGWLLVTLLLIGALCATGVPVVGPEVILSLLLIPPAVIRSATPTLGLYGPLSVLAGLLGASSSFVLSVQRDWPTGPCLVLCVLVASLLVGGVARVLRGVAGIFLG